MPTNITRGGDRWNERSSNEPKAKPKRRKIPIVDAVRDRRFRDNDILVIQCPYCQKAHWHGAGGKDSPLGSGNGHRAAHCREAYKPNPGYVVREVELKA